MKLAGSSHYWKSIYFKSKKLEKHKINQSEDDRNTTITFFVLVTHQQRRNSYRNENKQLSYFISN